MDPNYQGHEAQVRDVQEAARAIGRQVQFANAGNDRELEVAFATLVKQGATALLVTATPFFDTRRVRIVALAA
jgi:putative ABC transport system substrate-binding protein